LCCKEYGNWCLAAGSMDVVWNLTWSHLSRCAETGNQNILYVNVQYVYYKNILYILLILIIFDVVVIITIIIIIIIIIIFVDMQNL